MGSGANSLKSRGFFLKFSTDQWAEIYVFQSYGFPIKLSIDLWSFQ